jgi:hypothetical protein
MRKRLDYWLAGLIVAAIGAAGFLGSSMAQQRRALTDSFDPGLPNGAEFPPIRALYQGEEITDIDQFIRDKGAVFLANRSVDW